MKPKKPRPKPLYSREGIEIYVGDCGDIVHRLTTPFFSIQTDPPYGIDLSTDFGSRGRGQLAESNDYAPVRGDLGPFDPYWIVATGLPATIWGANYFSPRLPSGSGWLVWDKKRPKGIDQADCELAWTNWCKGVRIFRHLWNGCMRASERGCNFHPTQKPIALWEWVMLLPWFPKGRILDPYMGSGPVLCAAIRRGFKATGIELSEEYASVAAERCEQAFASRGLLIV
jgi:hypothetical protein